MISLVNGELVRVNAPDDTSQLWALRDVALRISFYGRTRLIVTEIVLAAFVVALMPTFRGADGVPTGRTEALHECNVTAQKRWGGKYDFERNQRTAYSACMLFQG